MRLAPRIKQIALRATCLGAAWLISCSLNISQSLLNLRNEPVPARWSKEPVIILSDTTRWSLNRAGDSNSLLEERITWYRVNRRNPPILETILIRDDETTETQPEIELKMFAPDGGRQFVSTPDFKRTRIDQAGVYASNSFESRYAVPGYREGMVIRERVLRIRSRPQFDAYELFRSDFPCLRRTLIFREPAGFDLRLGVRNGEGLAVRADTVAMAGAREIRYQADTLEKIQAEYASKYPEDYLAAFWYCVPDRGTRSWSWRETGDYYLGLIRSSFDATAGINPDSLERSFTSSEPAVAEMFRWIQRHIRYLADEKKMNAYVPRPPDQISTHGYGDCKEMSNLLRALCRKKGVEVGLALVRSGEGMQLREEFPALSTFNHMIAYRIAENGVVNYYDPTVKFGSPQASALHLEGQKILLLARGKSRIDTVRATDGRGNRIETRSVVTSENNGGGFALSGAVFLYGPVAFQLALKLNYTKQNHDEARACLRDFLRTAFGLEASTVSWDLVDADTLRIQYAHIPVLSAFNGGVTLALPALYSDWGEEKSGFLPPAEQQDEWTLPAGYGRLVSREAHTSLGDLHWKASRSVIQRRYDQRGGQAKAWRPGTNIPARDSLTAHSAGWVGK